MAKEMTERRKHIHELLSTKVDPQEILSSTLPEYQGGMEWEACVCMLKKSTNTNESLTCESVRLALPLVILHTIIPKSYETFEEFKTYRTSN